MDDSTSSWAQRLRCMKTGESRPLKDLVGLSPAGAPYEVTYDLEGIDGEAWRRKLAERPWSLWRYRELLPLQNFDGRVDLGEGATPLLPLRRALETDLDIRIKQENVNPTGSFKDRGMTMAVNRARELGVQGLEMASAGNAGISISAYASAAGIPIRVALPNATPQAVVELCRWYGAEVVQGPGTLVDAAAKLREFDDERFHASTFREPYRVEGKKTMGLEIAEQLGWSLPDWIVYPTGGGTGIVGMAKAFDELETLGLIGSARPRFVVVQMQGCAPLVRAHQAGAETAAQWEDPERTRSLGLRVPRSLADLRILKILREGRGTAVAVAEDSLPEMEQIVARREGMLFGPEGAACLRAIEKLSAEGTMQAGEQVVVLQTGNRANYGE